MVDSDCTPPPKEWGRNRCRCKDTNSPDKILKLVIQAIQHVHCGKGSSRDEIRRYIQNMHIVRMDCEKFDCVVTESLKRGIELGYLRRNQTNGKYYVAASTEGKCGRMFAHDEEDPLPCPKIFCPKPLPKKCPSKPAMKCPPKAPDVFYPNCGEKEQARDRPCHQQHPQRAPPRKGRNQRRAPSQHRRPRARYE